MDTTKKIFLFILLLNISFGAWSQAIKPKASIDSIHLLIGDQTRLHLEIEYPKEVEIMFPVPGNQLSEQVEVLERSVIDTIKIDDRTIRLSQSFLITSFDSGSHLIQPFWFSVKHGMIEDSVSTNPLMLNVYNIPNIDSLIQALQGPIDIKGPYDAPVTLKEVAPWLLGALLLAGFIFLVVYAIGRRRKNQPIFGFPAKPKEPAHIIALRSLDRIKEEKIWQQGHTKKYYSELTDVVRTYIEDRFSVQAMEQTSEETLEAFRFRSSLVDEQCFNNLRQLLTTADLVKFAKFEPLPDDNNMALVNAYFFVNQTKIVANEPMANTEEPEGDDVIIK